jgi:murein DD-endopeptidase MepM/ murein hydrolase activator NlpD
VAVSIALRALTIVTLVTSGCRSVVLSRYGTRVAVSRNEDGSARGRKVRHRGVDFKQWDLGDPVIAAADGIVRRVSVEECAGVEVLIEHARFNRFTFYSHLRHASVIAGHVVKRGAVIGEVGLYRCSAGVVHVHMELWPDERVPPTHVSHDDLTGTEDPLRYMKGCFDSQKQYESERLVLTYPVTC